MKIKVTDTVVFRRSQECVVMEAFIPVAKRGGVTKDAWVTIGYHGSFQAAARSLLTNHIELLCGDKSAVTDLRQLIKAVDDGVATIAKTCAGVTL